MNAFIGKHVEFKSNIEHVECGFDMGMRARVVAVDPVYHDNDTPDYWKFYFDFSDWEDYNKKWSKPNWYDNNAEACLRWHEMGDPLYPKNKIEVVYLDTASDNFKLIPIDIVNNHLSKTNEIAKLRNLLDRWEKAYSGYGVVANPDKKSFNIGQLINETREIHYVKF